MATKKYVITINQIKDFLKIHEQSLTNVFNSTLEQMEKKIRDLIGENAVLKNEVDELKTFPQFHTDQWEENFSTLNNLQNEFLQNQKQQQQQSVIPDSKEMKDKLNDLKNRRKTLRIDEIIGEGNNSWTQSEKRSQEIIKD